VKVDMQRPAGQRTHRQAGMTLVELICAFTILSLLAGMAVPLLHYQVRRDREKDLRWALKEIRTAIDKFKDAADQQKFMPKQGTDGYPETLEQLVDGVQGSDASGTKLKFLRRIPVDPMTGTTDWGLRSEKDDPKSQSWGGENVFDVYTKSYERARDGIPYNQW
jgi:general secretion pathway protein G